MRFVKPLSKAAKFTAVSMPLSIFGWQLNKRLFAWLRALWAGSINPTCPDCDSGILLAQTEASAILDQPVKATDKPQPLYPWACNHCGFTLLAGLDHRARRRGGTSSPLHPRSCCLRRPGDAESARASRANIAWRRASSSARLPPCWSAGSTCWPRARP